MKRPHRKPQWSYCGFLEFNICMYKYSKKKTQYSLEIEPQKDEILKDIEKEREFSKIWNIKPIQALNQVSSEVQRLQLN